LAQVELEFQVAQPPMVQTVFFQVLLQQVAVMAAAVEFLGLLGDHQAVVEIVVEHLQRLVLRVKEILAAAVAEHHNLEAVEVAVRVG
jgi:hypothetical protein